MSDTKAALGVGLAKAMSRRGMLSTSDLWGSSGHDYTLLVCLYLEADLAEGKT